MIRNYLGCRGCGNPFIARVAADSTDTTRFYIPCPNCHIPIRARASGQEFEDHRISFECDVLPPAESDDLKVVTINPYVPARYDSDFDQPVGGFSMMTLQYLLGDEALEYFAAEGTAREAVVEGWPRVQRIFQYYLAEDWVNFDRAGRDVFSDWQSVSTTHQRTTLASQAVGTHLSLVAGNMSEPAARFIDSYLRKHTAAIEQATYVEFMRAEGDAGELVALQRSIFELIGLYIERYEMWRSGRLVRWVEPLTRLDDLTLFRDEFPEMRDLYQQAFEVICKTLKYLVASQNVVKRGDPNSFGDEHPDVAIVPERKRPSSLRQFDRLSSAYKIAYVALVPRWAAMSGVLDNKARNNIGHASARHDLRSGRVVSALDQNGVTYLDFLAKVFDMFELLAITLQVVRATRVTSSRDFRR